MITVAIDNTIAPLSYTLGRPNITKEITTRYRRPVTSADRYIEVTASVGAITEKGLHLQAEVRNAAGKLVAVATASCVFIKPR